MSEQTTPVRTDELRPGDRVWHPFDIVCFTVAHEPKQETGLHFQGEPGLRVTGTTDRGETVHVDVAPAYKWHRGPKVTAPTTHAPLAVNTRDGVCWTRRTVTPGGIALYAPESARTCPDFVMATLAELAEHGIAGSAHVLPMPVGPCNDQTKPAATLPAPTWPEDWDHVLDFAIRQWQGEWTPKRVQRLYLARYGDDLFRSDARNCLSIRARRGLLTLHDRPKGRVFTLNTWKGGNA